MFTHRSLLRASFNNMVEQDHRGVKSRIKPMLFDRAAVTIAGVDLLHRGSVQSWPSAPERPGCVRDLEYSAFSLTCARTREVAWPG
jgi:hypothetical protein